MKCFIYWTADLKSSKPWSSQLWTQFKQLQSLFQASTRNCLNCVHNCDDHGLLDSSECYKCWKMWEVLSLPRCSRMRVEMCRNNWHYILHKWIHARHANGDGKARDPSHLQIKNNNSHSWQLTRPDLLHQYYQSLFDLLDVFLLWCPTKKLKKRRQINANEAQFWLADWLYFNIRQLRQQWKLFSDWFITCLCPGSLDRRASEITNKMAAVGLCTVVYGYAWQCTAMYDCVRLCMGM